MPFWVLLGHGAVVRFTTAEKISFVLGLLSLLGGGGMVVSGLQTAVGWSSMGVGAAGLLLLGGHHFLGWGAPSEVNGLGLSLSKPQALKRPISVASQWSKLDSVTLYEAASLWVGDDPVALFGRRLTGPAAAVLRRLEVAHVDRLITATNPLQQDLGLELPGRRLEPSFDWTISRAELLKAAKAWGERPAFLFPDGA